MSTVTLIEISHSQALVSSLGALVGAVVLSFVAFSFVLAFKKAGFRLTLALAIFFSVLAVNQFVSAITDFACLVDSARLRVVPFFEYRQVLLTISAVYVFYSLWFKNHKFEKILKVHEDVTSAMESHKENDKQKSSL